MFVRVLFKRAENFGLWSKLIAWWTKGPYSHTEIWLCNEPEDALCYSSQEKTGSRFKILNVKDTFDYVSISENNKDGQRLYDYCTKLPHYKYDWLGLFGFLGPYKIHDDRDRFCSEICFEVLEENGFFDNDEERWQVSPNYFAKILSEKFGKIKRVK